MAPEAYDERARLDHFIAALERVPRTVVRAVDWSGSGAGAPDAQATVEIGGEVIHLAIVVRRTVYPRDAREILWHFSGARERLAQGREHQVVPLLVAEVISPGARATFQDNDVGYFDASGSLHIPATHAFVHVDKPALKSATRAANRIFTGRKSDVLFGLWEARDRWVGVHDLAEVAHVSPATVSETLIELGRREWVEVRGEGPGKQRRLSQATALLDAWVEHLRGVRPGKARHYFVPVRSVETLVTRLDEAAAAAGAEYAITGLAAAQAYAPYLSAVSQVRCRLGAGAREQAIVQALAAHSAPEGWNLAIVDAAGANDLLFRRRINGLWADCPLRVYLDLVQSGGRSREMADHLRGELLQA